MCGRGRPHHGGIDALRRLEEPPRRVEACHSRPEVGPAQARRRPEGPPRRLRLTRTTAGWKPAPRTKRELAEEESTLRGEGFQPAAVQHHGEIDALRRPEGPHEAASAVCSRKRSAHFGRSRGAKPTYDGPTSPSSFVGWLVRPLHDDTAPYPPSPRRKITAPSSRRSCISKPGSLFSPSITDSQALVRSTFVPPRCCR